jgi:hypothetical protein
MIPAFLLAARLSCDVVMTALFTPSHPVGGTYRVCTIAEPIEALRERAFDPTSGPDAGQTRGAARYAAMQMLVPLDVFGEAGSASRSALARVYGGRRVKTVRGWVARGGAYAAITLLSPYPDASLTFLKFGTLVIVWRPAPSAW